MVAIAVDHILVCKIQAGEQKNVHEILHHTYPAKIISLVKCSQATVVCNRVDIVHIICLCSTSNFIVQKMLHARIITMKSIVEIFYMIMTIIVYRTDAV